MTSSQSKMELNTRSRAWVLFFIRMLSVFCRYKFQSSVGAYEDKTAILADSDSVWTEVRHMHMREAIDKLMADFNKFLEENAVFKGFGPILPFKFVN